MFYGRAGFSVGDGLNASVVGVECFFGCAEISTTDTIEQAIERAGTKAGSKGEEATLAVIESINLLRRLD